MVVTPNGKKVVSGSRDGTIRVWDMPLCLTRAQAKKLWRFLQKNKPAEEELPSAISVFFQKVQSLVNPAKRQREQEEGWKMIHKLCFSEH